LRTSTEASRAVRGRRTLTRGDGGGRPDGPAPSTDEPGGAPRQTSQATRPVPAVTTREDRPDRAGSAFAQTRSGLPSTARPAVRLAGARLDRPLRRVPRRGLSRA